MDLRICSNGQWLHEGKPIRRASLKKLFASILTMAGDGQYYLISPEEKWRIQVDDLPFTVIAVHRDKQNLVVTTDVDDRVVVSDEHPLQVGEPAPKVLIRGRLYARLNRNAWYQLIDLALSEMDEGSAQLSITGANGWQTILGSIDHS